MSMMRDGPSWQYCTTNLATASATPGTAHTPGTGGNFATPTSVIANCTHDVEYMVVGFANEFVSAQDESCFANIVIDSAGGSTFDVDNVVIPCLIMGHKVAMAAGVPCPVMYHLPMWFKSGTSFGVSALSKYGTPIACQVMMWLFGGNSNPASWWCGSYVEPIGLDYSGTRGWPFTPSNSGVAWGSISWTDIGGKQTRDGGAVQFGLQTAQSTETAIAYLVEWGIGSQAIGPRMHFTGQTSESGVHQTVGPIFCQSKAGSQWQARGLASGTAQALDTIAYVIR